MIVATLDPKHCAGPDCIRGGIDLSLYQFVKDVEAALDEDVEKCPCGCLICREGESR